MALLVAHTFAVDAEGNETSTIGLDYIRPFPEINPYFVEKLSEEQKMLSENDKNLKAVETAVEDRKAESRKQSSAIATTLKDLERKWQLESSQWQSSFGVAAELPEDEADAVAAKRILLPALKESTEFTSLLRSSQEILKRVENDTSYSKAEVQTLRTSIRVLSDEIEKPTQDFAANINNAAANLVTAQETYYDRSVEDAQKATVELSPSAPSIYGASDQTSRLNTSISKTEFDESEFEEDYFAPPVFANLDLIDLKKSSELYKELVGAQPIADVEGQPEMTEPSVANLKLDSYKRFLEFSDKMNQIFPIYGVNKANTEWGRKIDQPESAQSVRRWEEKEYLRRTGLLSLREFAKMYRLKIETDHSDEPSIVEFLKLTPSPNDGNSIFDKIVDEFALLPRDVKVKVGTGGSTTKINMSSDSAIEKLRKSVKDPMLFAATRQQVVLDYAKTHFGSRAFDGR
jgi:hypothetical protein